MRRRRQEAEDALRQTQAILQGFYDSSPFLMGVLEMAPRADDGEDAVILYCNIATARFLGKSAEDVIGNSFRGLGFSDSLTALWGAQVRNSQTEGRPVQFEYELELGGGNCWLSICINYLGAGPSGNSRFSFITEDITARKKNEALLRQSNTELRRANSDLEQFAYSASHDLQEPLRQIAIYSQLLAKKYAEKLDTKGLDYLSFCLEGALGEHC
jgi:PAS domain S-box-containing protein